MFSFHTIAQSSFSISRCIKLRKRFRLCRTLQNGWTATGPRRRPNHSQSNDPKPLHGGGLRPLQRTSYPPNSRYSWAAATGCGPRPNQTQKLSMGKKNDWASASPQRPQHASACCNWPWPNCGHSTSCVISLARVYPLTGAVAACDVPRDVHRLAAKQRQRQRGCDSHCWSGCPPDPLFLLSPVGLGSLETDEH